MCLLSVIPFFFFFFLPFENKRRLAKREQHGSMSKSEFFVALHLVNYVKQGDALPPELPDTLFKSATTLLLESSAKPPMTSAVSTSVPSVTSTASSIPVSTPAKRFTEIPPALSASLEGPGISVYFIFVFFWDFFL
jgi:hypothetical protein